MLEGKSNPGPTEPDGKASWEAKLEAIGARWKAKLGATRIKLNGRLEVFGANKAVPESAGANKTELDVRGAVETGGVMIDNHIWQDIWLSPMMLSDQPWEEGLAECCWRHYRDHC